MKYVVFCCEDFWKRKKKIWLLYSEEQEHYKKMNKILLILFSLLNFIKVFGIRYNLLFFCRKTLEIANNRFQPFFFFYFLSLRR